MIEIEFAALVKQCLDRRIPTQEQLTREVLTIGKERLATSRLKSAGRSLLKMPERNLIPLITALILLTSYVKKLKLRCT